MGAFTQPGTYRRLPAPKRGFRHHLAGLALRLGGWTAEGDPPDCPKLVVVAAPHTSLWDGFWLVTFAWWWGQDISWLVKESVLWGPIGTFLRWTGAIGVDRSKPNGVVAKLVEAFDSRERLMICIPPEGTRSLRTHWKSGFYHLAREAGVPICLSILDYAKKRGGYGPTFEVTGDIRADMDLIRAVYANVGGKYPERFTPPRLLEEDKEAAA